MSLISLGDLELNVSPFDERFSLITIDGLGGTNVKCCITISSIKRYVLTPDEDIVVFPPIEWNYSSFQVPHFSWFVNKETFVLNASVVHATLRGGTNVIQYATLSPNSSSVSLNNALSVTFQLHLKSQINESIYARAAYFVSR